MYISPKEVQVQSPVGVLQRRYANGWRLLVRRRKEASTPPDEAHWNSVSCHFGQEGFFSRLGRKLWGSLQGEELCVEVASLLKAVVDELVHLILRISPHHSHHLRSHHLSLPRPFTPDFKLICFINAFLRRHSHSFRTTFRDCTELKGQCCLFVLVFSFLYFFLATCARLS